MSDQNAMVVTTIVITEELRNLLRQWARQDDRSVSYILRKLVLQEKKRRMKAQSQQTTEVISE